MRTLFWFVAASALLLWLIGGPPSQTPSSTPQSSANREEPDEPCRVDAPPAGRAAVQAWCEGGFFTHVNVSSDRNNFVVLLQFSNKGQRAWTNGKYVLLNRFRLMTDEMVTTTDLNAAFTLFDTQGQMLGGCVRKRSARESTCN